MPSKVEEDIARSFRLLLKDLPAGERISDSDLFRDAVSCLEYFLSDVLPEIYEEWKYESLDGVISISGRKLGYLEAEVFGLVILMTDQTLTPVHLRFQIAENRDELSWLECKLGERRQNSMVRIRYALLQETIIEYSSLEEKANQIDWVYKAGFGERRK